MEIGSLRRTTDQSVCLSPLSKIFEKGFFDQLKDYFEQHALLSNRQFGFRPKMSTVVPVSEFVHEVKQHLASKKTVAGVFIDLRKAFHTVNI